VVETASKQDLFTNPKHPYTIGLFNSIPDIELDEDRLKPIAGSMPDPTNLAPGCAFSDRCEQATAACQQAMPPNVTVGEGHTVRCILFNETQGGV